LRDAISTGDTGIEKLVAAAMHESIAIWKTIEG